MPLPVAQEEKEKKTPLYESDVIFRTVTGFKLFNLTRAFVWRHFARMRKEYAITSVRSSTSFFREKADSDRSASF